MSKKKLLALIVTSIIAVFLISMKTPIINNIKNHTQTIKKADGGKKTIKDFIEYRKSHEAPIFVKMREIEEKKKAVALAKIQAEEQTRIQAEKERLIAEEKAKQEAQVKWINMEVTFYTISWNDCQSLEGVTANGTKLREYTGDYTLVAAPRDIPFNTVFRVEGFDKPFKVVDRGGAIKYTSDGKMILDVYVANASQQELRKLGRVITKGYIVK